MKKKASWISTRLYFQVKAAVWNFLARLRPVWQKYVILIAQRQKKSVVNFIYDKKTDFRKLRSGQLRSAYKLAVLTQQICHQVFFFCFIYPSVIKISRYKILKIKKKKHEVSKIVIIFEFVNQGNSARTQKSFFGFPVLFVVYFMATENGRTVFAWRSNDIFWSDLTCEMFYWIIHLLTLIHFDIELILIWLLYSDII